MTRHSNCSNSGPSQVTNSPCRAERSAATPAVAMQMNDCHYSVRDHRGEGPIASGNGGAAGARLNTGCART